jgi:hypothetical protein
MTAKTKTIMKKILAYVLACVVLILTYAVTMFIIDMIFGWFGGEDGVSWISIAAGCIAATAGIIIVDIINSRKRKEDRSDNIINICRQILWTTTIMFCGMMLIEWLIQRFSDKDFALGTVHWLSFSFACAIFDQLHQKYKEKKMQEDESALVVAAECEDMQTAEEVCNKLESKGIKAMIVEKDSPVYIKGNGSPVQIQVCRKDLEKSKEII